LVELEQAVKLIKQTIKSKELASDEAKGLLDIITEYADSWLLLQKYDEDKLEKPKSKKAKFVLNYESTTNALAEIKTTLIKKKEASELFAKEKDKGLDRIIGSIYQTFGGEELYNNIADKAAHLLYFITKDHPFADGNKRSAAFLFILFLARNDYLFNKKGEKKFNDNALVALTLLIAESDPKQKDLMIKLIQNFIV